MVMQQDNTRPSTSLNTFIDKASPETTSQRTRVERLIPLQTHTAATHISADNKYSLASKTADLTKTAPRSIAGQLLRSLKPSTNIDFFAAVSHKTSPRIGRIAVPKPIGFAAPPSGSQKTRRIGQCKHAPFILSRSFRAIYTACRTPYNFASIWAHCPITRDTRQQQSLFAQCRAATQTPP